MAYEKEPVQTHRGFEQERRDYKIKISGGNTTLRPIPEARHPQSKENKGYKRLK
jgi:hypothetical protein